VRPAVAKQKMTATDVFVPRRLGKYLRDCTPLSVNDVRAALSHGRVTLDGQRAEDEHALVFEEDDVRVDGRRLVPRHRQHTAMLHKPLGVTSTVRDPRGKADLSRWLDEMPAGMFPIGRLDRNTSGLLLFTTDGDLANAVLRPDHHTDKVYWLWLDEHVPDGDPRLGALLGGVPVLGRDARARSCTVQHRTEHFTELLVTLDEGRNRQIRRMCRALDFHLNGLHRRSIGPLELGELPSGAWRLLDPGESDALWQATGGRRRAFARKLKALARLSEQRRHEGAPHVRLDAWLSRHGVRH